MKEIKKTTRIMMHTFSDGYIKGYNDAIHDVEGMILDRFEEFKIEEIVDLDKAIMEMEKKC